MFERRYALVAATSLNAPVYRSLLKPSAGFGLASTLARMPPTRTSETDSVLAPPSSLDQRLQAGVALVQARQRAEGWAWFHEGEFRRAARAFESVTLLEPQNTESRIGELFCHVSLRAISTAVAVLRALDRRNENPFLDELDLVEAYPEAARARELGVESRLWGHGDVGNPDLRALHVLILWYLGERDEAVLAATSLVRDFPGTTYADWPAKMRAARKTLAEERDQP